MSWGRATIEEREIIPFEKEMNEYGSFWESGLKKIVCKEQGQHLYSISRRSVQFVDVRLAESGVLTMSPPVSLTAKANLKAVRYNQAGPKLDVDNLILY